MSHCRTASRLSPSTLLRRGLNAFGRPITAPLSAALLTIGLLASVAPQAEAAVPATVRESGRIIDNTTREPVSGLRMLTFRLYASQDAAVGAALWSESYVMDLDNGYYTVQLGSQTPFDDLLRSQDQLWLGVTLDSSAEFSPRNQLAAVPYARLARDVAGVINPDGVRVAGVEVIDERGNWVGPGSTPGGGTPGPAGPQGPAGPAGTSGPAGPQGPAGAVGPIGPAGTPGPAGIVGPQGPVGATGPAGPQGLQGLQGIAGPTGAAGPQGSAGLVYRNSWQIGSIYTAGDVVSSSGASYVAIAMSVGQDPAATPASWGVLSDRGATGAEGAQGVAGPAGPAGATGPVGPAGATGPAGPSGPQGVAGAVGPIGPAGAQGPVGIAGPQGPVGATGPAGPQGLQGLQGIAGPTGAAGPQGSAGLVYRNIWQIGSIYTAGDVVSRSGASYVATAMSVGQDPATTPGSWGVLSDRGATGANGTQGVAGPAGPAGAVGPAGAQGPAGPTGLQGVAGAVGATGPIGPAGPTGATGTAGANGQGVPTGGTAGQVLAKVDGTDFNAAWTTPAGGGAGASTQLRANKIGGSGESCPLAVSTTASTVAFNNVLTSPSNGNSWNGSVFTVGSGQGGLYMVQARAHTPDASTPSSTVSVQLTISINNTPYSPYSDSNIYGPYPAQNSNTIPGTKGKGEVISLVPLAAGDTIRIYCIGGNSSTLPQALSTDGGSNITIVKMN